MNDPVVDEVRNARDSHAARFNYDLDAIFRDIKEQERKSGRTFLSFPPRTVEPNHASRSISPDLPTSQTASAREAAPAADPQR